MSRYLAIPLLLLLAVPAAAQDDDAPTIDDVAADAVDALDAIDRAGERIDEARRAGDTVGEELGWDYQTLRDAEDRARDRQDAYSRQRGRIGAARDTLDAGRERAEDPAGLLSWGAGYLDEITAAGASVLLGAGGLAGVQRVRRGKWVGGRDRAPNTSPRGDEEDPLDLMERAEELEARRVAREERRAEQAAELRKRAKKRFSHLAQEVSPNGTDRT